ncbi:MAG: AAA family ATPase, partial [Acidimicrobiales bacterium]
MELLGTTLDALERDGAPSILAVSGEAGIGKSRLLVGLCGQAEKRGLVCLRGRAAEFERDLPFGVFADAVDDHLASLDPTRLPAQWLPELSGVFPALQSLGTLSEPGLLAERYRTHRAVRALLEHLGTERPLVLVLDDVHWADPASVEALSHLLNHPPSAGVVLAMAFRPAQAPPPLVTALATATRDRRAQLVELPPLTRPEAEELLGPALVGASREAIYRESGGNPFYLEQLARVGRPAPAEGPVVKNGPEGDLPPLVRAALNSELNDLSPGARALVEGAAVAGDPFEFDLAAVAANLPEPEALARLDELVDRDLVRATDVPRRYRFRHPILRRAVYNWCGPGWRMTAHGRMAAALKARGFTGATVAHHVERSAYPGDEEAIALLVDAASSIMPCIPASAAHWYRSALRLLPPGADRAQERLELQVAAAMALPAAGELEEGHAALLEVLEQLTPGPGLWVGLVAMCAGVEVVLGRLDEGRARLTQALKALGDETTAEAGVLKLELCSAAAFTGDYLQVQALADEILRSNQSLGQPTVAATAACLLAMAEYSMGRTTEADLRLTEAVPLFDALEDAQLADRIDAAMWLAIAEMGMERFEDAIRHLERGISVSRAAGRGQWIVALMHCEALALTSLGRLDEARDLAATAVEAGRLAGHAQALTTVLFEQSWAAIQAGDLTTAIPAAEEAVDLARGFDPGINGAMAGLALARALLESGEPERARAELLAACGGQDLCHLQRGNLPTAYEI